MSTRPSTRREFVLQSLQTAGLAACSGLALTALSSSAQSEPWAPRPPGAHPRLNALCLKCGLCVQACPYGSLRLASLGDGPAVGTPFFEPRREPCQMCPDIPCVKVCPSGALDRSLSDISDARMGIAVIDPSSCLSWQGLRCEVCFRVCPVQNKALTLRPHPRELSRHAVFVPEVDPEHCTGCGLCTWSCPTQEPAIHILEPRSVLGRIGDHYRLSWKTNQPHHPRTAPAAPPDKPALSGALNYLNDTKEPL